MNLFPWLLFAHILGAIIAFGPTFSSPLISQMGRAEPMHGNFATRLGRRLVRVQTLPLAIVQGITGVALIWAGNIDVFKVRWLLVAIALYVITLGFAFFVQTPVVSRILAITTPAPGAAPGPPPGGPPPELPALARRARLGGYFLITMVVSIVFLMVMKPF